MSYQEVVGMYGPHNARWVDQLVRSQLPDERLLKDPRIVKIIEKVLARVFGLAAGSPVGTLISFELSEKLSQDALDSTHTITEENQDVAETLSTSSLTLQKPVPLDPVLNEFEKCMSFSGLLNTRKSKHYNFIHMLVQETPGSSWPELLPWRQIDQDVYAVPTGEIQLAVARAKQIKFITQPYKFPNQLCTFVSLKHMYDYFARRNNMERLIPLLHILALVASKNCVPIPTSRHGLKQVGVDFLSRSSFENVLANFEMGAIDQHRVSSDKRVSAMFLSQKLPTGTHYFDLLLPSETVQPPAAATVQTPGQL